MGAPKKNKNAEKFIDWDRVDDLLRINATGEEIASVLNVDYDTISNHCKKEKGILFSEYIKKENAGFKTSLKRLQFRSALGIKENDEYVVKPSITMQIWLGKQYLGQAEKQEIKTEELPTGFNVVRLSKTKDGTTKESE